MGSLLLWTWCPASLGGEFVMIPVPTVLGKFSPGSVGGGGGVSGTASSHSPLDPGTVHACVVCV